MSQSYYDKYSKLCIQNLEKITYDTIIYRERVYYDLIDVDDRIHLVFTDDYYRRKSVQPRTTTTSYSQLLSLTVAAAL